MTASQRLLGAQSGYFLLTGVWPIVHIESFEAVTGPKLERWLVKTVGAAVSAIGVALAVGARRAPPTPETVVLSIGSASALGAIDLVYAAKGRISPVYLVDAGAQAAFIVGWAVARRRAS